MEVSASNYVKGGRDESVLEYADFSGETLPGGCNFYFPFGEMFDREKMENVSLGKRSVDENN